MCGVYVCVCVCACVRACVRACVCVCVCVFPHKRFDRTALYVSIEYCIQVNTYHDKCALYIYTGVTKS